MALTNGINHVSIVTRDLDRLRAFYCETLDAQVMQLRPTPFGGRICILRIGDGAALNLFEIAGPEQTPVPSARFHRGALDHFGITAADPDAFWTLRARLMECGCSTGEVTDFGPILGTEFTDPDGITVELDLVIDPSLAGGHPPVPYLPSPADSISLANDQR